MNKKLNKGIAVFLTFIMVFSFVAMIVAYFM